MGYIPFCLMCLGTRIKMYPMNPLMIKIYNEFISTPHKKTLIQMYACYECTYLLHKYTKFKTKCCKAYNILCSLSPESFEVTEECLLGIDRKQNDLASILTAITLHYDYQPDQKEVELDKDFNIQKVKPEPITCDRLINDNNDPLHIMQIQEMQLDVKSSPENSIEDNYQPLDVKSIPELDFENDYQFNHTYQVEPTKDNSNKSSMLWLTIQRKNYTESSNKPHLEIEIPNQKSLDTPNNYTDLDNYLDEQESEIHGELDPTDVTENCHINAMIESNKDVDEKPMKKNSGRNNENRAYDVSDTDISGCLLTLDSKILNEHMTVIDLTPDDARREFLLRKKSSNYTRNPFKCDLCYRGFLSKTSYESHLKKHSLKNGAFQCDICKLCFIGKSYLNQHRIRMHRRKFSCKMCPYVCFAQTQCNAHILSHRGKKYTCKKCGMTYRYRNSLLTHMHLKHSVECVCEFCGGTFASEYGLYSHKHLVHRQEKNDQLGPKCDECDVHFASELAWKRHRVLCSRHEVQFGCKVCGDVFQDSDSLKTHSREHGTMDFRTRKKYLVKTCIFCKVGLPNIAALKNHLTAEHPTEITDDLFKPKSETSYVCEFCGKAFSKHFSLVIHQKRHSDEMPYSCPDCGMKTKYKYYLAVHRRTHTDEFTDKFQCDLCGRPFSDKGRLVRHMKAHMGIRPYKCVPCDKTFMFRCDERSHYKHVHDKEPYPKKNESKRSRKKAPRARIKMLNNI